MYKPKSKEWFVKRIGKRIYRNNLGKCCAICDDVSVNRKAQSIAAEGEYSDKEMVEILSGVIKRSVDEDADFIKKVISETREEMVKIVEAQMLDKIYYIGDELPQVKQDVRTKFVLLGTPADFLKSLTNTIREQI